MPRKLWGKLPRWKQALLYLGIFVALVAPRLYNVGTTGLTQGRIQPSRHEQPVMGDQARQEGLLIRNLGLTLGWGYLFVAVPLLLFWPNKPKDENVSSAP